MTTAKQLREFLATIPDDTIVRVLALKSGGYENYVKFVDLNLGSCGNTDLWGMANTTQHLDLGSE